MYPTRHRPEFIRQALRFLSRQQYADFEVIVSDNYTDPALSCEQICRESGLRNLRYVRPPSPVGMVENWNHGFGYVTGDYVAYFTDKMLLLPDTLALAAAAIEKGGFEIVNWPDAGYSPRQLPDYFGPGKYDYTPHGARPFQAFDPRAELSKKGRAAVRRSQQDAASYARGKICFGAFSRILCDRIVSRAGALFHPIAPDYTSMILGLSLTRSAGQLTGSGIVHLMTDLSNGALTAIHDDLALRFLRDLGGLEGILAELPVPGVYSAQNNTVARDYLTMKRRFALDFDFDLTQWLLYIEEDLENPNRRWSSPVVESEHKGAFARFVSELDPTEQDRLASMRARRAAPAVSSSPAPPARVGLVKYALKRTAVAVLPRPLILLLKRATTRQSPTQQPMQEPTLPFVECESIDDVLGISLRDTRLQSS